jgi:hypothetical protein
MGRITQTELGARIADDISSRVLHPDLYPDTMPDLHIWQGIYQAARDQLAESAALREAMRA